MYACIYVCLYVCILYVSVFEGMYVLPCADDVQLKVSDNQPMIGLNGPGKTLPCLQPNPLLLLLSSRETS